MEKSTLIALGLFVLIIVGGVTIFSSNDDATVTGGVVSGASELSGVERGGMRHVSIDAEWFEFNPDVIRVKQGEDVMLMINNLDVTHGINIPELGLSGNSMISFTADKKGEFDFYCDNFCGKGHKGMVGKIIVE